MPTCGIATDIMQAYIRRWGIEKSMIIVFSVKDTKERTEAAANFALVGGSDVFGKWGLWLLIAGAVMLWDA